MTSRITLKGISRRRFVQTAAAGAAAAALRPWGIPVSGAPARKRLNVLHFVPHDLGRHCAPYVPVKSPNLQAFGQGGAVFRNAFCASPACSPSRGCVMTGLYAHNNGLTGLAHMPGWQLPAEVKTIVDYFNDAGYQTAHAGQQHERKQIKENRYQKYLQRLPAKEQTDLVENVVDDVIAYLKGRSPDDPPFYVNAGTKETHATVWRPDTEWNRKYKRTELYGIDKPEDVYVPPQMPDNQYSRQMMGLFQPCLRHLDKHFARLAEELHRLGYGENTLIVFGTDHGIIGSRGKTTIYDHGTEIALMMQLPGVIKAGSTFSELITNVDYLPTILEAAGIPVPESIQGRSFWPLITGGKYQPREALYIERNFHTNYDPTRAVRTDRYHYIRNFHPEARRYLLPKEILALEDPKVRDHTWGNEPLQFTEPNAPELKDWPLRPREELYDIQNDPAETVNLAADPSNAAAKEKLSNMCAQWMKETNDPLRNGLAQITPEQKEALASTHAANANKLVVDFASLGKLN